jgi:hypothetical protein
MGTRYELPSEDVFDGRLRYIIDDISLREWMDTQSDVEDVEWGPLLEKLGFLFEFFARSTSPRGMAMRVWSVLYAVRPDLIRHETILAAATRFEVSEQRLCEVMWEMKKQTGITYRSKVGIADSATQRRITDAMHAGKRAKAARFAAREEALVS